VISSGIANVAVDVLHHVVAARGLGWPHDPAVLVDPDRDRHVRDSIELRDHVLLVAEQRVGRARELHVAGRLRASRPSAERAKAPALPAVSRLTPRITKPWPFSSS
jgi:hypothetical protein